MPEPGGKGGATIPHCYPHLLLLAPPEMPLVEIGLTELPNSGWAKAHHFPPASRITVLFLVSKIIEEIIFHLYISKEKSSFIMSRLIMSYLVPTYLELINFAQPGQLSKD